MARLVLAVSLLGALAVGAAPPARVRAQRPPDIVLIVADDLGWGDLGAYGQTRIRTPNLDRLAAEGMRFTQAYAGAPVCAPSRCVLMTGLHGGHCPVGDNHYPNAPLRVGETTIAALLRDAGYRTVIAGKWGLGGELADGTAYASWSTPWRMGYDEGLAVLDQGVARDHWPAWMWLDGERLPILENLDEARGRYAPDAFVDEALAAITRTRRSGQPLFLYFAHTLPHREIEVEPSEDRYPSEEWPAVERTFASMVSRLDDDVGRILAELDALGATGETLVIVTSDNGAQEVSGHEASFFGSSGPWRGRKRDLYEGGIRVPMIARWPGVIAPGSVSSEIVGLVDVVPTLCAVGQAQMPAGLDGRSFAGILRSAEHSIDREALVWTGERRPGGYDGTAIRHRDLKLIVDGDGSAELFDLASDPGEARNLAASRTGDADRLRSMLERETRGGIELSEAHLDVEGGGLRRASRVDPIRTSWPVLHLDFDRDQGAIDASAITTSRSALAAPVLRAVGANGASWSDRGARSIDPAGVFYSARLRRDAVQYLVVPWHPAFAWDASGFSVEASVRLASRQGRQWLLFAKRPGRGDAWLDFGVLVRAGTPEVGPAPIFGASNDDGSGLMVVFGEHRLRGGTWAIASHLAIEDGDWHRLSVRVDFVRSRARFSIDDRHDETSFEDLRRGVDESPLTIGAAHDASGTFTDALDGWIDDLRINRGWPATDGASSSAADERSDEAVLDFGTLGIGAGPRTRSVLVRNAAAGPARRLDGNVDLGGIDDPRVRVVAPPLEGLVSGDAREIRVTLSPDAIGPLRGQSFRIDATSAPLDVPARGAPLIVRVEGEVIARAPIDAGPAPPRETGVGRCGVDPRRGPSGLPVLGAALLLVGGTAGRRRRPIVSEGYVPPRRARRA